jgi:hypothetical protein
MVGGTNQETFQMRFIAIAALAAAAFSFSSLTSVAPADARKCVKASAKGTGLGNDLATQQARQALSEGLEQKKMKGRGKVSVKCGNVFPLSECTASQRACG